MATQKQITRRRASLQRKIKQWQRKGVVTTKGAEKALRWLTRTYVATLIDVYEGWWDTDELAWELVESASA